MTAKKLTKPQLSTLNVIDQLKVYADGWSFNRVSIGNNHSALSKPVMRRLSRMRLIELSDEATTLPDGTTGRRVLATSEGRAMIEASVPRIWSSSLTETTGNNPRKRTRILVEGDVVLMPQSDGTKEWRMVRKVEADRISGYFTISTSDDMGYDTWVETFAAADRRWTVRASRQEAS